MTALGAVWEGLSLAVSMLLCVPVGVLALQVFSAAAARRGPSTIDEAQAAGDARPRLAVLMPAHDEARGIAATIASALPLLAAGDRLLVVADNCSDDTARLARNAGAGVVERHDPVRRGKGYALDFGVRALAADPPEVVVVMDADCVAGRGAVDRIARLAVRSGRPVQALYLMKAPPGAPLKTRIAEFAWLLKNHVRALGFRHLGLPCQLMGSGMAFPWAVIDSAPLASGHIVEDLQLGLDLAAAGTPPLFCPDALVSSVFPLTAAGLASQRTRWEQGHLSIIASIAPRLFLQALRRRQGALAAMALDVCVPPLTTLVVMLLVVVVASAATAALGGSPLPLFVSASATVLLASSIVVAWRRYGRAAVSAGDLARVPLYILGKLPMYARMLWRRQTEWIRTERDDHTR